MRAFLSVVACLGLNSCGLPGGLEISVQANQYSGDGIIHTCSNLFMAGYGIDFPSFDASRQYAASYRLSHVPQTGREPVILVHFHQPDIAMVRKKMSSVTGVSRITLRDATGHIVHSAEVHLSTAGWGETQRLFGINVSKRRVRFERAAYYTLSFSYAPGAVPPPAKQLYLAIDNCAFK